MIINVCQIKSGVSMAFDIRVNEKTVYKGVSPSLRKAGAVSMVEADTGTNVFNSYYRAVSFVDWLIPFTFKRTRKRNIYELFDNSGEKTAVITKVNYELIKEAYYIEIGSSLYKVFPLMRGNREVLLVYLDNQQVAQIERSTITHDLKDNYVIYLPDEAQQLMPFLSMFVLYYDHTNHGNRGEVRKGFKQKEWKWSYTEANELYDPSWIKRYFPNVNVDPVPIDNEYNEKVKKRLEATNICMNIACIIAVTLAVVFGLILEPKTLISYVVFILAFRLYSVARVRAKPDSSASIPVTMKRETANTRRISKNTWIALFVSAGVLSLVAIIITILIVFK